MPKEKKQIVINAILENEDLLIEAYKEIWENPEVGLQEHQTAKLLIDILERNGFTIQKEVSGMPTAFVATFGSGKPTVGIMGELDALPGLSQKSVPHKEPVITGAPGHGCGHVGYAVAALGGVLGAKSAIEEGNLSGTIKYFGCPAEETLVGKVFMVRDGVFDGLDACIGHHPGHVNSAWLGTGNALNSSKFEFFGVPSHAAGSPEQGRSALDAVELMNIGVNYLREHVVQEARIHYVIEDGGHEPNIVPAYARVWYYIRAPNREMLEIIYSRIRDIAKGADLMAHTTHKETFLTGVHETLPNRALAELLVANMREIGAPTYDKEELEFARKIGETIKPDEKKASLRSSCLPNWENLLDIDLASEVFDPFGEELKGGGGSTDVAEVSWITPTLQFYTTAFVVGAPGHSWQNVATCGTSIGHKSTVFASKVIAATLVDLMIKTDLLKTIQGEWKDRIKDMEYLSPIPPDLKPPLDQLPSMTTAD